MVSNIQGLCALIWCYEIGDGQNWRPISEELRFISIQSEEAVETVSDSDEDGPDDAMEVDGEPVVTTFLGVVHEGDEWRMNVWTFGKEKVPQVGKGHGISIATNFRNAEKFYVFCTFCHLQRVACDIPLRFLSLPPNAEGGNYEYFAIVNNSLTKTIGEVGGGSWATLKVDGRCIPTSFCLYMYSMV